MILDEYKSCKYQLQGLMNKEKFPVTMLSWSEYEKFNEIYAWAKENCLLGEKTASGGIKGGPKNRYHSIYFYNKSRASIELIIAHRKYGCYKFVVAMERNESNKLMPGKKALKTVLKLAEDMNCIDVFKNEAVTSEEGLKIKSEIESPMISMCSQIYKGREFEHCYHIDANSSYFSRLCEEYPALTELGHYLYDHRKENNGKYKAAMTNSIGAMQSKYCLDINNKYYNTLSPYQLSQFAKVAVNGTNRFIQHYLDELILNGFEPLLVNTDGIWYRSADRTNKCFHDDNEGLDLGQWKHDHKDVKLYIKSAGAYQYIENGKCKTVLRGICTLDYVKPDRDTWGWKEIAEQNVFKFKFDEERGIIKYE